MTMIPSSSQPRIMLVEDIPAMRLLVRQMLRSLGVNEILEANDGSTALQLLRAQPVDVVLSDWNMIPMTGLQLLMAMREDPQTSHIPFVMITGEGSMEHVKRARSAGVNGYLIKPFGLDALTRQLTKVVRWQPAA
ncbi:response regulator [Magnetospirillum sulfuroxidans]|nr:response regulator [Magnetospirillum sulfuroxidans]